MSSPYNGAITPPIGGIGFGLTGVQVLIGPGVNPNVPSADSSNSNLANCGIGSLYICTTPGSVGIWQKTGATALPGSPTGTWGQLS